MTDVKGGSAVRKLFRGPPSLLSHNSGVLVVVGEELLTVKKRSVWQLPFVLKLRFADASCYCERSPWDVAVFYQPLIALGKVPVQKLLDRQQHAVKIVSHLSWPRGSIGHKVTQILGGGGC